MSDECPDPIADILEDLKAIAGRPNMRVGNSNDILDICERLEWHLDPNWENESLSELIGRQKAKGLNATAEALKNPEPLVPPGEVQ